MRNLLLCLLIFSLSGQISFGQRVSDVRAEALDEEGRSVEIFYTLEDDVEIPTSYKVTLYGVFGNNKRALYSVIGDVGDSIRVGTNRIIWQADKEFPRFKGNIFFEVRVVRNFMILKPEANVVMKRGKNYRFEWFGEGSYSDELMLVLYQYNSPIDTIAVVENAVAYTWDIPKRTKLGDSYQLRISGTNKTNIVAFSRPFSIKRKIPLIVPIGSALAAGVAAGVVLIGRPPTDGPLPEPPGLPEE